MVPSRRWSASDDEALRAHHDEGISLNEAAKRLGWSPSTVSKHGQKLGLDWARIDKIAPALIAARMTNADKRVRLETRLLDVSSDLLDQLNAPALAYNIGGKDNTYADHMLDGPDSGMTKNILSSVGIAIDRALKIAEINAQAKDQSDVDRWLDHMTSEPAVEPRGHDAQAYYRANLDRRDDAEPLESAENRPAHQSG